IYLLFYFLCFYLSSYLIMSTRSFTQQQTSEGVIRKVIKEALSDQDVLSSLAEALINIMLPMIVTKLQELNDFNADFAHNFSAYKKTNDDHIEKLKTANARKMDALEQYNRL